MNQINQFSIRWFEWIVAASWQLALLVCIVGLACYLTRNASPRLRYALWLLVLVKVFLPPGLATPWSVGSWGLEPMAAKTGLAAIETERFVTAVPPPVESGEDGEEAALETVPEGAGADDKRLSPAAVGFLAWAAGGLLFWARGRRGATPKSNKCARRACGRRGPAARGTGASGARA